ncbi:hypothetical protein STENM223S_00572 [Streptomyces tendae]
MKYGMNTHTTQLGVQSDTCNNTTHNAIHPTSPVTIKATCATQAHRVERWSQAAALFKGGILILSPNDIRIRGERDRSIHRCQ